MCVTFSLRFSFASEMPLRCEQCSLNTGPKCVFFGQFYKSALLCWSHLNLHSMNETLDENTLIWCDSFDSLFFSSHCLRQSFTTHFLNAMWWAGGNAIQNHFQPILRKRNFFLRSLFASIDLHSFFCKISDYWINSNEMCLKFISNRFLAKEKCWNWLKIFVKTQKKELLTQEKQKRVEKFMKSTLNWHK